MFGFLKEKLKDVISKITKKAEEPEKEEELKEQFKEEKVVSKEEFKGAIEQKEKLKEKKPKKKEKKKALEEPKEIKPEIQEELKEEIKEIKQEELFETGIPKEESKPIEQEKKGFFSRLFSKKELEVKEEKIAEEAQEKKGFFGAIKEKIITTKISEERFSELFDDLELALLENNVAFEVIDKIKEDLKKEIVEKPIKRGEVENTIRNSLKESIEDLFLIPKLDLIAKIKEKPEKPFIICFVGQNGSGKTTSIAKLVHLFQENHLSAVLAASDTFRAASIHQLKEWGNRLNTKVIAHDYGSDPAAVAFDSIKYAQAHNLDVVLIDTAGRQHSNKNLMAEMQKIVKVAKPDLKIFVGEAITGNDCIEQAKEFNEAIGIDGIILAKADIDEKGGAIISTSFITHRPIVYLGTGQNLTDLKELNKDEIVAGLGL